MKFRIPTMTQLKNYVSKESPTILTVTGLISLGSTVFFSIRNGIKIKEAIKEKKEELGDDYRKIDGFKAAVVPAIPIALSAGSTAACMISSNRIAVRRLNELTAAYEISQESLSLYKRKMREVIGEKKSAEVRDEVNKERSVIHHDEQLPDPPKKDQMWFVDTWSGATFLSTLDKVKDLKNQYNADVLKYDGQDMNDWYYLLGLEPCEAGKYAGFTPDLLMELRLDPVERDGRIIIYMDYVEGPYTGFRDR